MTAEADSRHALEEIDLLLATEPGPKWSTTVGQAATRSFRCSSGPHNGVPQQAIAPACTHPHMVSDLPSAAHWAPQPAKPTVTTAITSLMSSGFTIAGTDPTRAPFCADWQPHGLLVEGSLSAAAPPFNLGCDGSCGIRRSASAGIGWSSHRKGGGVRPTPGGCVELSPAQTLRTGEQPSPRSRVPVPRTRTGLQAVSWRRR